MKCGLLNKYSFYGFFTLAVFTLLTACGGGEFEGNDTVPVKISISVPSNAPSDSGEILLKSEAPSPGSVTTVNIRVEDASAVVLVSTSLSVSPGDNVSVQLNVPAGNGRNFIAEAIDARNIVLFQGQSGLVNLFSGVTTTVTIPMTGVNVIFVDLSGVDGPACGTQANPCRTISQGLNQAVFGQTVQVAAGTYDAADEVSPIAMKSGVDLVGSGGVATILDYINASNVTVAFQGADNVLFTGFGILDRGDLLTHIVADDVSPTITNNIFTCAIASCPARVIDVMGLGAPTVTGNTIGQAGAGFSIGIQLGSSGIPLVNNNTIIGNTTGIGTGNTGSPRIEGNTITGNNDGVAVGDPSTPDLGRGTQSSGGGNVISCNTNTDLTNNTAGTVLAQNNQWDHVPPIVGGVAGGGIDIFNFPSAGGSVDASGATLASPNCP